ncbi:hypothetical protein [Bradyrhizobium sp. BWC-3-1]
MAGLHDCSSMLHSSPSPTDSTIPYAQNLHFDRDQRGSTHQFVITPFPN